MKVLNYVEVPSTKEQDINRKYTEWRNGKCVSIDEGAKYKTLYIGHKEETVYDEEGNEGIITKAFPIRMEKPVTRDMAINAAEMEAYGLRNAMEVASFNASLARKTRINPNDEEVTDHDAFIGWVKEELTKIGVV